MTCLGEAPLASAPLLTPGAEPRPHHSRRIPENYMDVDWITVDWPPEIGVFVHQI